MSYYKNHDILLHRSSKSNHRINKIGVCHLILKVIKNNFKNYHSSLFRFTSSIGESFLLQNSATCCCFCELHFLFHPSPFLVRKYTQTFSESFQLALLSELFFLKMPSFNIFRLVYWPWLELFNNKMKNFIYLFVQ